MAYNFEGVWRLFHHSPISIREQMALDETLLQDVNENGPALCFYDIAPVTISLGAFQPVAATFVPERFKAYQASFVRRPTGGQALLHKQAVVFSVIVGREHFIPFRKRELYLAFAPLFVEALTALGIAARIHFKQQKVSPGAVAHPHPHCFAGPGEYEVVTGGGRKLIGSAQIITRQGCLQQNFIPLDDSYRELEGLLQPELELPVGPASVFLHTDKANTDKANTDKAGADSPQAASLTAAAGRTVDFAQVQAALVTAFRQSFTLQTGSLSRAEQVRMQKLLAEKYNTDAWNYRY
jgi:lipoate-protein ligase A